MADWMTDFIKEQDLKYDMVPKSNKLYQFSNEGLIGVCENIDFKDKTVLTVGSSCDQALMFYENGAREVDLIDICPFVELYYDFKRQAILNLDYKLFRDFFAQIGSDIYFITDGIKEGTKKIFPKLNSKTYEFFNYFLFELKQRDRMEFVWCEKHGWSRRISYLNKEVFNKYKESTFILKSPNFITENIVNYKTDKKYDIIYLSNLVDYLVDRANHLTNDEIVSLEKFYQKMLSLTTHNGIVMAEYFWRSDNESSVSSQTGIYAFFQKHSEFKAKMVPIIETFDSKNINEKEKMLIIRKKN
jgi:hypothetical protein